MSIQELKEFVTLLPGATWEGLEPLQCPNCGNEEVICVRVPKRAGWRGNPSFRCPCSNKTFSWPYNPGGKPIRLPDEFLTEDQIDFMFANIVTYGRNRSYPYTVLFQNPALGKEINAMLSLGRTVYEKIKTLIAYGYTAKEIAEDLNINWSHTNLVRKCIIARLHQK